MSEHALLGASDSPRWSVCAGALNHTKDHVDTGSKYASEGTAAHSLAAHCLTEGFDAKAFKGQHFEGDPGDQWLVTDEMVAAVQVYLDLVREAAEGGTLLVEQRVNYAFWLGVKDDLAFGTSDTVILKSDLIHIIDFKYGMGEKVDAVGEDGEPNAQLCLYALGALHEHDYLGDFKTVRMTICQPRIAHTSEHEIDVTTLKTFALKMKAAAHRALSVMQTGSQPSDFSPGYKACRWCSGKATCPALLADVETETRDLFASFVPGAASSTTEVVPAAQVDEHNLARLMDKVPLMEDLCKAVRAEVERRLLNGHEVTGYKLIEGRRGARQWSDVEAVQGLMRDKFRLKVEDMYEMDLISPTQAEKKLKDSPRRWKQLEEFIVQSDGKPSVAPESHKSPALKVGSVEEKFAALADVATSQSEVRQALAESVADGLV